MCKIKITKVYAPPYVKVSDSAQLICEVSDEGENVYSLKWYLGQHEFYRWIPTERDNPVKTFDINVFQIDPYNSKDGRVQIHQVSLEAAGVIGCEVCFI